MSLHLWPELLWLRAEESRCHRTQDTDLTGLVCTSHHPPWVGSVSLEATAILAPKFPGMDSSPVNDKRLDRQTWPWGLKGLGLCGVSSGWGVSTCTLKFYLYCKENKKDPTLGLEGEAGRATGVSGCAPCRLYSGCSWPRTRSAQGGLGITLCKNKNRTLSHPHFSLPQMKDAVFLPQSLASGSESIKALERFLFPPGHGCVFISGRGKMGLGWRSPWWA